MCGRMYFLVWLHVWYVSLFKGRSGEFDFRDTICDRLWARASYWLIIIPLNPNFQVTTRPSTTQSHKLCWSFRLQNRKWISVWISKHQTEYQVCETHFYKEMPQNESETVPQKNLSISDCCCNIKLGLCYLMQVMIIWVTDTWHWVVYCNILCKTAVFQSQDQKLQRIVHESVE